MIVKTVDFIKYEDIIELIKLEWPKQFGEVSEDEMINKMYENNDHENDKNIVMTIEDKIVGWCRYTAWPKNDLYTKSIHLLDIVISDQYQGKGFASLLITNMFNECRKSGKDFIYSRTFVDNIKSISLHKKNGFEIELKKVDSIVWKYCLAHTD